MPSPSVVLTTLRPDLGGSFTEFDLAMRDRGFIAGLVLPVFETIKQSGPFGKIPLKELLKNRDTARAPGSGYARAKFTFVKDSFSCEEHGAEEPVDDRESEMYREYFDAEQASADIAMDVVLRNAETRAADLLFNATTWTGGALTTIVGTEWSVLATATPIADVEAAIKKVWDGTGLWPNALIIGRRVFRNLRNCAEIIDRIKYSGHVDPRAGEITAAAMAGVFDIEQVIVADSPKNTANEAATPVIAPIWSDEYAMVARVARGPNIKEPCVGRTFHWGEDGSSIGGTVETYREEAKRSEIVRVRHDVHEKVLYIGAAHLLSNITA